MESEEVGWEVKRKEAVQKKAYWVIVVRNDGVRGPDAVLPGQMPAGEIGGARGGGGKGGYNIGEPKNKSRSIHINRF